LWAKPVYLDEKHTVLNGEENGVLKKISAHLEVFMTGKTL